MPADERIKVIFRTVHVKDDADVFGSGEWYFNAHVDGRQVGNPRLIFNAVERLPIHLPESEWSAIVNVQNKAEVRVDFKAKDQDVFVDDELGPVVGVVLRPPWRQNMHRRETRYYVVEIYVELAVEGHFGVHPPDTIFACRSVAGSGVCSTVNGTQIVSRLEIHPIRPVPAAGLPNRPVFPAGTAPATENGAATNVSPTSLINIIPNPAVIPLMTPAEAAAVTAFETAARIECTYFRPSTLNFTDNDPRLEWSTVSVSGGAAAQFLGPARGLKVLVYGTHAGQVRLEVRLRGALMASYRAIVAPIKRIPFRVNILNGPTAGTRPRSGPGDVQNHIAVANRFLRQIGLELTPDADATVTHGAVATAVQGVFRIAVTAGVTHNVAGNYPPGPVRNSRANVLNIAYVHSIAGAPPGFAILGRAVDIGRNALAVAAPPGDPQIADNGTPTTSWYRAPGFGCGVPPDPNPDPAGVRMSVFPQHQRNNPPNRSTLMITNGNGDPTTPQGIMLYGKTIAHELGHVLTLHHRTGAGPDGLGYPAHENVMCQGQPAMLAQDFDVIQALALRGSGLVPP